jgi:hypothetical protein
VSRGHPPIVLWGTLYTDGISDILADVAALRKN